LRENKLTRNAARIFNGYLDELSFLKKDNGNQQIEKDRLDIANAVDVTKALRGIDWSFTDNDTTFLSHDIHPYPAKFIPQIPGTIIDKLSFPGDLVWDPFGGSGTTALEALLRNRRTISTDINPIGQIIGQAKTTTLSYDGEESLLRFLAHIEQFIENTGHIGMYINKHEAELSAQVPEIPNFEKWFSPQAIHELSLIKHLISVELTPDDAVVIARASLSKIVTKASNQDSETRYSAADKNLAVGEVLKYYHTDMSSNLSKIKALGKLLMYRRGEFVTADVSEDIVGDGKLLQPNQVDLIVTSPPYPNAFDYHLYHRFRIFWMGFDPREMAKVEIGSHLRYQKQNMGFDAFRDEMLAVLKNCYAALKPSRYAVFVLGDAIFAGELFKTAQLISESAKSLGFEVVDIIDRPLHDTKRSVKGGSRRAKEEQLLVLRKPDEVLKINLVPVQYKLWPYEKHLREMEKSALVGIKGKDNFTKLSTEIRGLQDFTFYKGVSINGGSAFPTWQSVIENGDAAEAGNRKDPKYITHGLHPYKGKFYPQLVRPLINISKIPKGSRILDPFSGSGTIALEAVLNGHKAFGCDINPIAVEIAKSKTEMPFVDLIECEYYVARILRKLLSGELPRLTNVFTAEAIQEIERWFPAPVIDKLSFILYEIGEVPDERIQRFLRVLLSSIIREISQQEPSDLRIRRRGTEITDAPVFELYSSVLNTQMQRLVKFAKIRSYSPNQMIEPQIWYGSSADRDLVLSHLEQESIDLIITSPPYATALPYIDTNRLSLLVLDGLTANNRVPIEASMIGTREIRKSTRKFYDAKIQAEDFAGITSATANQLISSVFTQNNNAEVGFRRKNMAALLYMYFEGMTTVFSNLDVVLRKSGQAFIVIGDTKTTTGEGLTIIQTTKILREIADSLGWVLKDNIPISVTTENYKHINNAITENTILHFEK
jgi:DNA modification methylase